MSSSDFMHFLPADLSSLQLLLNASDSQGVQRAEEVHG